MTTRTKPGTPRKDIRSTNTQAKDRSERNPSRRSPRTQTWTDITCWCDRPRTTLYAPKLPSETRNQYNTYITNTHLKWWDRSHPGCDRHVLQQLRCQASPDKQPRRRAASSQFNRNRDWQAKPKHFKYPPHTKPACYQKKAGKWF